MADNIEELRAKALAAQARMSPEQRDAADKFMAGFGQESFNTGQDVVQEQHPDISNAERFVIKNFGGDVNDSIDYLRSKHKDNLQIANRGGEIIVKRPDETTWKVIDPQQGFVGSLKNPVEALKDVGDIGYDVLSGIGTGAATAAAGLAGGVASGGIGALPSAMAASAGSSTVAETLRQGIGQILGTRKDASGKEIAASALIGGLTPLLPGGTGAAKAAIAATGEANAAKILGNAGIKTMGGKLTSDEIAKAIDMLGKSQRGLLTRAGSKIGQAVMGVNYQTIENAVKPISNDLAKELSLPVGSTGLDIANKLEKDGVGDMTAAVSGLVHKKIDDAGKKISAEIGAALENTGQTIDVGKYFTPTPDGSLPPFLELMDQYRKHPSQAFQSYAKELQDIIDFHFSKKVLVPLADGSFRTELVPITELPASQAMMILQDVKGLTQGFHSGEGKKIAAKDTINAAKRLYGDLSQDLYGAINAADKELGGTGNLSEKYKAYKDLDRLAERYFGDQNATYNTLRGLNNKGKKQLQSTLSEMDQKLGTNVREAGQLIDVASVFGNPSFDALSGQGGTSTSRTVGVKGLMGAGGYYLASQLGAPHPLALLAGGLAGFTGTKFASPAMLKAGLQSQQAINRAAANSGVVSYVDQLAKNIAAAGKVTPTAAVRAQTIPMIWNQLRGRNNQ